MDQLGRGGDRQRGVGIAAARFRGGERQHRAQALATGKNRVVHGVVQYARGFGGCGQLLAEFFVDARDRRAQPIRVVPTHASLSSEESTSAGPSRPSSS